jgi:hypothetical protein
MKKVIIPVLAFILMFVLFTIDAKADCLVVEKSGNIRSGPGTNYDIVGKAEKGQIIYMPSSFKANAETKWYPIEEKRESTIVEGWYRSKPWKIGISVEIGNQFLFLKDDTESWEEGRLVEKLPGERIYGFISYKYGKFRMSKGINYPKWVHISLVSVTKSNDIHRYISIRKSSFSKTIQNKIIERKVWIGMTKEMALLSWGKPDDINKTTTAYGVSEQWVYRYSDYKAQYLYFKNGILTAIQKH